MKTSIFLYLPLIFLFSCKKEYVTNVYPTSTITVSGSTEPMFHFSLATGNYWIFREQEVDGLGNVQQVTATDSTVITGDTLINNLNYKIKKTYHLTGSSVYPSTYSTRYLMDSLGFIVDANGNYFDQSDFTTIYHYVVTGFNAEAQLVRLNNMVFVPSGWFNSIDLQRKFFPADPNYQYGTRMTHEMYADTVGLFRLTFLYYSNPNSFERILIRYHIN